MMLYNIHGQLDRHYSGLGDTSRDTSSVREISDEVTCIGKTYSNWTAMWVVDEV